jgi:hypothetical protein
VEKMQIWDNIILVQEAIHSSKARVDKGMIIIIDMENSFDRVRHSFLMEVLGNFGFSQCFIRWIGSYINNEWIAPLIKGRLEKTF